MLTCASASHSTAMSGFCSAQERSSVSETSGRSSQSVVERLVRDEVVCTPIYPPRGPCRVESYRRMVIRGGRHAGGSGQDWWDESNTESDYSASPYERDHRSSRLGSEEWVNPVVDVNKSTREAQPGLYPVKRAEIMKPSPHADLCNVSYNFPVARRHRRWPGSWF